MWPVKRTTCFVTYQCDCSIVAQNKCKTYQNQQVTVTCWTAGSCTSCNKWHKGSTILSEYWTIKHYHFISLFIVNFIQSMSAFDRVFTLISVSIRRIPKWGGSCKDPGENKRNNHKHCQKRNCCWELVFKHLSFENQNFLCENGNQSDLYSSWWRCSP